MKYVKEFADNAAYTAYTATDYPKPNVSLCVAEDDVHYTPPPPPPYSGFCKLTLNTSEVVEIEGSGRLTQTMITPYKSTCVSAEVGPLCTSFGDDTFSTCTSLTSVTISDSVTYIGSTAFYGCSRLTSVTLGSGITSIGGEMFRGCSSLSSITIPDSVTIIGNYTFMGCRSLSSITIPSGVTSMSNGVFSGCSSLSAITSLAITAPTLSYITFQNIKTGGTLYVPQGSSGYDVWMGTGDYYLGRYGWTKVEQ